MVLPSAPSQDSPPCCMVPSLPAGTSMGSAGGTHLLILLTEARQEVLPSSRPSLCGPGSKNYNCSCCPLVSPPAPCLFGPSSFMACVCTHEIISAQKSLPSAKPP